jgi:hypothetical protein
MKFLFPSLALTALLTLGGCAWINSLSANSTEQTLAAAGFQVRMADTPERQSMLQSLPPYQVTMKPHGNSVVYVYADPKKNMAMIGGPAEYQKYQQLNIQQNVAADQVAAAQMNEMAASEFDYDSMWGPLWW